MQNPADVAELISAQNFFLDRILSTSAPATFALIKSASKCPSLYKENDRKRRIPERQPMVFELSKIACGKLNRPATKPRELSF